MGKEWDGWDNPASFQRWVTAWARECLRVLKPGGHMLAFGGTRTWHRLAVAIEDAGFEMRDSIAWVYGSGFPKHRAALKPAFEPIVMGRKPFKGSLTANEAIHGTGALSIDACRIAGEVPSTTQGQSGNAGDIYGEDQRHLREFVPNIAGRWPANVILDEHTAELLDEQSGNVKTGAVKPYTRSMGSSPMFKVGKDLTFSQEASSGGASRFFYVAKAPKTERPNVDGIAHPTVKPLALMRWLCKLVTPEHGTILDTFAGSGTTIEAAILEGFNVIGIERESEYLPLIQHRINRAKGLLDDHV